MIRAEIIDDEEVLGTLAEMISRTRNPRPALQDIGEILIASTKRRFITSTAPDGSRWAELSDTTLLRYLEKTSGLSRRKTPTGGRTLTASGVRALAGRRPLIGETRRLSREIYYRVGRGSVAVGSPLEYAGTHQFGAARHSFTGGRTPWGDVPARPIFGISTTDRANILDTLRSYLGAS